MSPVKLVIYQLRFSQITLPLFHTYMSNISLLNKGNSQFHWSWKRGSQIYDAATIEMYS